MRQMQQRSTCLAKLSRWQLSVGRSRCWRCSLMCIIDIVLQKTESNWTKSLKNVTNVIGLFIILHPMTTIIPMNKHRKRTRKGKMIESESSVTSLHASPNKPPPLKNKRTDWNEKKPRSSIMNVNGRMTTNVTCQVSEVVISKTRLQEKKENWGSLRVSWCTILDGKWNSMNVKSLDQQTKV